MDYGYEALRMWEALRSNIVVRTKEERNWSQYNRRLKRHARVELFLSNEVMGAWHYSGMRRPGGVMRYSDGLIKACLLLREYFGLPLRQTQGFIESLVLMLGYDWRTPDYTTLSRRCARMDIELPRLAGKEGLVIAVDSTGLSVHSRHEWNRLKHKGGDYEWKKKWRKLHIAVDTGTGLIKAAAYSAAEVSDGERLDILLSGIDQPIKAVCADMAYDTVRCRKALYDRDVRQLIPPLRKARLCKENRNLKIHGEILKERDDAIHYIRYNQINKSHALARASWKQKAGYHARSLVETAFSQIKSHTSGKLSNRLESTRKNQAILKCILINKLIQA